MGRLMRRRGTNEGAATMGDADVLALDFYGLRVAVEADDADLLDDVRRDFSYFRAAPAGAAAVRAAMRVTLTSEPGPRGELPRLRATLQTPRNIVYRTPAVSYVDYFGRALMTYGRRDGAYTIYCAERDLAHEIAFLTILSRVGEHLDRAGLHRVHALGLQAHGAAVLVLLPMGGGKTTLTLRMLQEEGVRLLSEDSPLVSRTGQVFPFPLRIGVRPGEEPPGVPPEQSRTVQRMEVRPEDAHRHRALPGQHRRSLPARRDSARGEVAGRPLGHPARAAPPRREPVPPALRGRPRPIPRRGVRA